GRVKFFNKKNIQNALTVERNTPTGTMNISTPEVTVYDLIKFNRLVGGMDHVANVIAEMMEQVKIAELRVAASIFPLPVIQRTGYVFERIGYIPGVKMLQQLIAHEKPVYTPLEVSGPSVRNPKDEKWKIILNTDIEIEY
ncbi:MAG: hypothetical protein H8E18_05920, partial [FCB group bacterium]|nr:hypothetical protein [FCB group bacterium]